MSTIAKTCSIQPVIPDQSNDDAEMQSDAHIETCVKRKCCLDTASP